MYTLKKIYKLQDQLGKLINKLVRMSKIVSADRNLLSLNHINIK